MKLVMGVCTESPTMTDTTPTEMRAVYQLTNTTEIPTSRTSRKTIRRLIRLSVKRVEGSETRAML